MERRTLMVRVDHRTYNLATVVKSSFTPRGADSPLSRGCTDTVKASEPRIRLYFSNGRSELIRGNHAVAIQALLCEACEMSYGTDTPLFEMGMHPQTTDEYLDACNELTRQTEGRAIGGANGR